VRAQRARAQYEILQVSGVCFQRAIVPPVSFGDYRSVPSTEMPCMRVLAPPQRRISVQQHSSTLTLIPEAARQQVQASTLSRRLVCRTWQPQIAPPAPAPPQCWVREEVTGLIDRQRARRGIHDVSRSTSRHEVASACRDAQQPARQIYPQRARPQAAGARPTPPPGRPACRAGAPLVHPLRCRATEIAPRQAQQARAFQRLIW
jgi:hypothetical protein